jgi:hypothetical protein
VQKFFTLVGLLKYGIVLSGKISRARENGLMDHRGGIFGYENLYVADGALLPEAPGAILRSRLPHRPNAWRIG